MNDSISSSLPQGKSPCNDFYVYELAYPESMGGAVFYVGKGRRNRIDRHEQLARKGAVTYKSNIIRKIWSEGEEVAKRKVCIGLSEQSAFVMECDLIAKYGRENLANMTDGGEGSSGRHIKLGPRRNGRYRSITVEIREDLLHKMDRIAMMGEFKSRREVIEVALEMFFDEFSG